MYYPHVLEIREGSIFKNDAAIGELIGTIRCLVRADSGIRQTTSFRGADIDRYEARWLVYMPISALAVFRMVDASDFGTVGVPDSFPPTTVPLQNFVITLPRDGMGKLTHGNPFGRVMDRIVTPGDESPNATLYNLLLAVEEMQVYPNTVRMELRLQNDQDAPLFGFSESQIDALNER